MLKNITKITCLLLIFSFLFLPNNFVFAKKDNSAQNEIDQLNQDIKDKTAVVDELNAKIRVYQENMKQKQDQSVDLQNQISILEDSIGKTQAEIAVSETEISKLSSEIKLTKNKIEETTGEIDTKQNQIGEYLLSIYQSEQKTNLEIFLANDTLSNYFSVIEYEKNLHNDLQGKVGELQVLKDDLSEQKDEMSQSKLEEVEKKATLDTQNESLKGEKYFKDDLLTNVESDETKFQELIKKVRAEQASVNAQIDSLEKQMRTKLEQNGGPKDTNSGTFVMPVDFSPGWPLDSHRVTATFHDPSYPFRTWFEHDAVDIGTSQGSPVYAADSGVVAIAKHDGTTSYSYIMIIHADGFATLYGHMSKVYVQPNQEVTKGETIGLSGGMPGTEGAGSYTTGPHLHFGVRLNGIPVDPLNYLP